jgi:hypothetical protein
MTFSEPGTQGAKRATWRANDPRPILEKILIENPKAEQTEWWALFWQEIVEDQDYLMGVARYYFDNALVAHFRNHQRPRLYNPVGKDVARKEALSSVKKMLTERIQHEAAVVLLDLVMPNGKALRDCTGKDCRKIGGWCLLLAKRVPMTKTVAETLNEEQVQAFWKQAGKK